MRAGRRKGIVMSLSITKKNIAAGCLASLMLCGTGLIAPISGSFDASVLAPVIAQAKSSSTASTIKNGEFSVSYTEFVDNLNTAFKSSQLTEFAELKAVVSSSSSELRIDIMRGTKTIGYATLYDDNDNELDKKQASKGFDDVTFFIPMGDDDSVAYGTVVMYAAFYATNPELAPRGVERIGSSAVNDIVSALTDSVEVVSESPTIMGGGVNYQGIKYTLLLMDDMFVVGVEVK